MRNITSCHWDLRAMRMLGLICLTLSFIGCGPAASTADKSPAAIKEPAPVVHNQDSAKESEPAQPSTGSDSGGKSDSGDSAANTGAAKASLSDENTQANAAESTKDEKQTTAPGDQKQATAPQPPASKSPFPHRIEVPEFSKDAQWLNTAGRLRKQDLKGKFVLLDFWTYCCINCMHILPELKKLERAFPNELVVIGVHSAKFDAEKDSDNIAAAIERYEIEHPVVNDPNHEVWQTYGVNSWPTVLLIDPEGYAVWGRGGEIRFEEVAPLLTAGIEYYRERKTLDTKPVRFELIAERRQPTPLRFPGKVVADEAGNRLFISDSNHNRIVITDLSGKLLDIIGSGKIGRDDGAFDKASFDHPQGTFLHGDLLYVADTENHMLRKVDLKERQVTTIAGTGVQSRGPWPGMEGITRFDQLPDRFVGKPRTTPLNSPWDLWVHEDHLLIAMAGPHQIWKMPLTEAEIGPYAGNGREDIVDGPLLPPAPYDQGYSSFAQPSGLSSDGTRLFVADSEGSSVRAVPLTGNEPVQTVVGTSRLPQARLFTFGDQDSDKKEEVLLQHPIGLTFYQDKIYVTDTYNNKIKEVDPSTGATRTISGTGAPGKADEPAQYDEPAGISGAQGKLFIADTNNHAIRVLDIASSQVTTLEISDLTPPKAAAPAQPDFSKAVQVQVDPAVVKPVDGKIRLAVQLNLAKEWKINADAPTAYWLAAEGDTGAIDRSALGERKLPQPNATFEIDVPVKANGDDQLTVSMRYFYCREGGEGICKVGAVVWKIPVKVADDGSEDPIGLSHNVPAN